MFRCVCDGGARKRAKQSFERATSHVHNHSSNTNNSQLCVFIWIIWKSQTNKIFYCVVLLLQWTFFIWFMISTCKVHSRCYIQGASHSNKMMAATILKSYSFLWRLFTCNHSIFWNILLGINCNSNSIFNWIIWQYQRICLLDSPPRCDFIAFTGYGGSTWKYLYQSQPNCE